jgi:hypothetical protein
MKEKTKKQKPLLSEKESAQVQLKKLINGIINGKGLRTAELQTEFLLTNKRTPLPTTLNHKETLRIYQLTIQDYKNKLIKKQKKQEENGN